ncbi:MAG: hypothetical protein LBN43_09410 [Oscillospiraceae bacterium]|jgi:cell division septum initiation protein DivIVA|nr:hypothetical protein [Oscillospiraceae bacterium]
MNAENGDVMSQLEALRSQLMSAKKVPLMEDMFVINKTEVMDILDDIRANFPTEIASAKNVLRTRDEFIANAKIEAEKLKAQAKDEIARLVEQQEIVRASKERARQIADSTRKKVDEMIHEAERQAAEIKKAARENTEESYRRIDAALTRAHDEVRQAWQTFRNN